MPMGATSAPPSSVRRSTDAGAPGGSFRLPSRRGMLLTLAGAGCPWRRADAAEYPERPIVLVVPFGPGGIADLTARALGQALAPALGQPIVIDNRPSAGSIVASQAVAAAAPDGHTLLLMSNAHAVAASLFERLPYDAARDFAPVALLAAFDVAVFADARSRWQTLADVLGHARPQPGALTVGTVAVGSTQHLAARLFEQRAGIEALVVPYKGSPALLGQLQALGARSLGGSAARMQAHLAAETRRWAAIIRNAKIHIE